MADYTKHLEKSWNNRANEAKQKAMTAIAELKAKKEAVNFNSVHIKSGLSKNYLYKNEEIRAVITKERYAERAYEQAWHSKYDKTSKSKDVIIATKDKYIAKLESENQQLRKELNQLRAIVYEQK